MLTTNDRVRLCLKEVEFRLSDPMTSLALSCGVLSNPYLPKDDEMRCIFIHIPKAAGSSLRKALYGTKSFHIPASRYRAADVKKFDSYFKFCIVRNPWSRLFSAYHYLKRKCDGDMNFRDHRWAASHLTAYSRFSDFVLTLEDPAVLKEVKSYLHFRNQVDWISEPGMPGDVIVDFVGKYETISSDYRIIEEKLGVSTTLPIERQSLHSEDYRGKYTPPMVDLISEIYEQDIKVFRYDFE